MNGSYLPSRKKIQQAERQGKFLQIFTNRGPLYLVLVLILLTNQYIRSWVTIQKLLKSILIDLSFNSLIILTQLVVIVFEIFFINMLSLSFVLISIDIALRRFHLTKREKLIDFNKLNPACNLQTKFKGFKAEILKFAILFPAVILISYFLFHFLADINIFYSINTILYSLIILIISTSLLEVILNRLELKKSLAMDHFELRQEQKEEQMEPFLASRIRSEQQLFLLEDLESKVRKSKIIFINNY